MLRFLTPTPATWVAEALADPDTILLDHAHCEKKAAATAVNMLFRYPHVGALLSPLSRLAREELMHFEIVLGHLSRRGVPFRRIAPSAYASHLTGIIRSREPERLLDFLLVFSMIESRSCERMRLLAEAWPDPALRALYRELLASEERHHELYYGLATELYPALLVESRMQEVMRREADAVLLPPPGRDGTARLHATIVPT